MMARCWWVASVPTVYAILVYMAVVCNLHSYYVLTVYPHGCVMTVNTWQTSTMLTSWRVGLACTKASPPPHNRGVDYFSEVTGDSEPPPWRAYSHEMCVSHNKRPPLGASCHLVWHVYPT